MTVPNQVKEIAQISRIFYFSLHAFALLLLVVYKCELQNSFIQQDIIAIIYMFGKLILASYFFMICGRNPGQHYQGRVEEINEIQPRTNSFKDEESSQNQIQTNRAQTIFHQARQGNVELDLGNFSNENVKPCMLDQNIQVLLDQGKLQNNRDKLQQPQVEEEDKNLQIASPQNSASRSSLQVNSEDEDKNKDIPEMRFCKECLNVQPYRSKHCTSCQKCIPKYDHHCFWIGGCVGELNHRSFWAFLTFQSWINITAFFQFFHALDNYSSIDVKTGAEFFQRPYYILFIMAFITFCFSVFTTVLAAYHLMLLSVGQTTWEQTKRDSITYLKLYPKYYNPFNYGIIKNFQMAFCHNNQLQQWDLPSYSQAQIIAKSQFNCFENQYYSCC